jgi:hypothetical protein
VNTTDQASPMIVAQTATVVVRHLTDHGLPDPASLHLTADWQGHPEVRVQLAGPDLLAMASALLAWAASLTAVSFQAWRPSQSTGVHLELHATLTDPAGPVTMLVYGGIHTNLAAFAELDSNQTMPLTLDQLTEWAGSAEPGAAA